MVVKVASRAMRYGSAGPASTRHHAQLLTTVKRPHKIVMEEVTQQRKSLVTVEYHRLDPPDGYTFVPAGDPELTAKCKEFARLKGSKVYVVSTSGPKGNELSQQVHRVGYHFPSDIVRRACVVLDIDLDQLEDFLRGAEEWPDEKPRRSNIARSKRSKKSVSGRKGMDWQNMSQEDLDKQARAAILDMFPAMPKENLRQIVDHAFEIGSDRVGVQVSDLSLPRRAQLAVVAHIRHEYTEYDELLREMSWAEARKKVAPKTLEKLALWRGDKDDEPDTMEDILREVIVISDDENEDDQEPIHPRAPESPGKRSRDGTFTHDRDTASREQQNRSRQGHGNQRRSDETHWIRTPVHQEKGFHQLTQSHRQYARYQVWEQTRGRLRQENQSIGPHKSQQTVLTVSSPGSSALIYPSQVARIGPPKQARQRNHQANLIDRAEPRNNPGHHSTEPHMQTQEVESGPYPVAQSLRTEIIQRPSNSHLGSNTTREVIYVTMDDRRPQYLNPKNTSMIDGAHLPVQSTYTAHPVETGAGFETVLPSIESPRAEKGDFSYQTQGNVFATVNSTSSQGKYSHIPSLQSTERVGLLPSKRRREQSPVYRYSNLRQPAPHAEASIKDDYSHREVQSTAEAMQRDQGKIVYLEKARGPTYYQSALNSHRLFEDHASSHHVFAPSNIPDPTSSVLPTDMIVIREGLSAPKPHNKETLISYPHTRVLPEAPLVNKPQRRLYDHTGKQVYITEPVGKTSTSEGGIDAPRREIPVQVIERQVAEQPPVHQRFPRRRLPLEQPQFTEKHRSEQITQRPLARNSILMDGTSANPPLRESQGEINNASAGYLQYQYRTEQHGLSGLVPGRPESSSSKDRILESSGLIDTGLGRLPQEIRGYSDSSHKRNWSSGVFLPD